MNNFVNFFRSAIEPQKVHTDTSIIFWLVVTVLLILALSNLALTFFAMGVLRLGTGMESIEFITGTK